MQNNPEIYYQLGGEAGIIQTVGMMIQITNQAAIHPWIRDRAVSLVSYCKRAMECESRTLNGYVYGAVTFIRDPAGTEALHDPVTFTEARIRSGQKPYGDCDDLSMYLGALLKSVGHHPYFRIIDRNGTGFHHVMVYDNNQNYDPTMSYPIMEQPERELYYEI